MQLIYLYIDGYCSFHEAEFNFSQDLKLHYNTETFTFEISDTHSRLSEQFWGKNISNLSVVVGNNGTGKTSLMQYIIDIFLEAHGGRSASGQGILLFAERKMLYGYFSHSWQKQQIGIALESRQYKFVQLLNLPEVRSILGKTKMIYLSNALSMRDSLRGQWYNGNRFAPLYDCSLGYLLLSDIEKDINQNLRQGPMGGSETEGYFLYEQYKQIKFVFDKKQHQICKNIKADKYPVPVPERLYIDLLMENQLQTVLNDIDNDISRISYSIDRNTFQDIYPDAEYEDDPYIFLKMQLSRCAIWCAVRSAARCMDRQEKTAFAAYLYKETKNYKVNEKSYIGIFANLWKNLTQIKGSNNKNESGNWETLRECYRYYIEFLNYINSEKLEKHFHIDEESWNTLKQHPERKVLTFTIDTEDTDWFMEFIYKYRYICNPDYFLDFRWGLSSGENSLLSLFASFYYLFDADFTNEKNGDYKIINSFEQHGEVQCDSVILLIDEADLTYHPEWQRVFIALLTEFLPRVYPPKCCKNIQVILSTHSPILLSDVPQQSVLYLKKDPEKHCTIVSDKVHTGTFGQNIHLLFKDSFFMENGTIGLFARKKIDKLVSNIKEIEKKLDDEDNKHSATEIKSWKDKLEYECRPYAELIAEPIMQRKVLLWINALQQKLSQSEQKNQLQRMSEKEILRALNKLQTELNRRKHDQNFDL